MKPGSSLLTLPVIHQIYIGTSRKYDPWTTLVVPVVPRHLTGSGSIPVNPQTKLKPCLQLLQ